MTGDDDRTPGRNEDDEQDYREERPRGGRGKGGKGYRDDPPPPPDDNYGDDDTPPPPRKGYRGDDAPPPPPGKGYRGDDAPPPPGKGYRDAPPPPGKGYGDRQPPRGKGYRDDKPYDDGGDYEEEPCTPVDPLCDDDPEPGGSLRDFKIGKARAETGKALEPILEAIALGDPAYYAKCKAIEAAYAAATAHNNTDNLRKRYCNADVAFLEAVNYQLAKAPGQPHSPLQAWVYRNLCEKGAPVRRTLIERRQVELRLRARKGPRELAFQDAHERTQGWAAAWTAWSDPVKNIEAIVKSYDARIGTLKDLFNDKPTADKAIFEFWFEVAPLHLGLRPEPVDEETEPGVGLLRAALSDFEDVQAWLTNAEQQGKGGLYLIDSRGLHDERERVLQEWEKAANDEAIAKADYDIWPDDAAKLTERYAGLKGDKWLARVKTALSPPAAE